MSKRGLFSNYFYGNPDKRDFTENDLPATRLQLFREVLKVRKGSMVNLNFLYLLIWLPAASWTFMNFVQLTSIEPGMLSSLAFTYLLVLFPLAAITGPFTAGVSYVMRNWARDEHAFTFMDFKKGMRENWKQALLLSAINGALPLLVFTCALFYMGMAGQSVLFYLPIGLVLVAALLWSLSYQIMPAMLVSYDLRFSQLVKNALIITMASLPKAIAVKLLTLLLPILAVIAACIFPAAVSWVGAITVTLYAVFMLSFNKLITASFANAVCEKYINSKIEGAQVNIGLRSKDEE